MGIDVAGDPAAHAAFAQRRADVLSGLVRILSSEKEPAELTESAVNLVAGAAEGINAFVYFWDPEAERLVLRSMNQANRRFSDSPVEMRLGEGIAGWAALRRQPVLINGGFVDDPRHYQVEGTDESAFRSVLVVPIYDEAALYGVFAMYSAAEEGFGGEELAIAEEVGLLLASALSRAQTFHELEKQSATARFLIDLPASSTVSFPAAVRECSRRILMLLDADVCIINYSGWLTMTPEPVAIAERTDDPEHPKILLIHSKQQVRAMEARFEQQGVDQISSSLGYGVPRGVLTCLRTRRFVKEEKDRLRLLSTQVGVLIENIGVAPNRAAQTMALLASDREDQMLESLKYLGWQGTGFIPVLVQVKKIGTEVEAFGRYLQETVPAEIGAETLLAESGTLLVLLVPSDMSPDESAPRIKIAQWLARMENLTGMTADIGIGTSTMRTNSIRNSIIHARSALAWANFSSRRKTSQIVDYESIRQVRELPGLLFELSPGVQQRCELLRPLQQYDESHGTQLLETVETLALHGGAVASASDALFVHRNTLRQRMSRISNIIGSVLGSDDHWTELLLAARHLRNEAL